ncbi:hypothetical protein HY029_02715 [Candidatus Gottesmanbacteria bacterium]|nr:hypothetical protein [Candidatus Gottesmanbacteria bacterium]
MKFIFMVFVLLFFLIPHVAFATTNPLDVANNKYGIHVIDEHDFPNASNLVNSSGGDWGYITLVITDNDRKKDKWQRNFDLLRSLHLIPIIRLATHPSGDIWAAPKTEDARNWADFLNSLYWVSKNRYVILFNEPNHATEWGGYISPSEYAQILTKFSETLKSASKDFFILPAGLDASAPNGNQTMDEIDFIKSMINTKTNVFSQIDGWVSHSYPNPGFRGLSSDEGRGTLKTYRWEIEVLKNFGVNYQFPVFITETGWPHADGLVQNKSYYSVELIAELLKQASQQIWDDPQIVAITPFILNYQSIPFANFSWTKLGEKDFYPYYYTYKNIPKIAGKPILNSVFGNFNGFKINNLITNYSSDLEVFRSHIDLKFFQSLFLRLFKL